MLGGYALVNLRANYDLNPSWNLGARLENLFDRDYDTRARLQHAGAFGLSDRQLATAGLTVSQGACEVEFNSLLPLAGEGAEGG